MIESIPWAFPSDQDVLFRITSFGFRLCLLGFLALATEEIRAQLPPLGGATNPAQRPTTGPSIGPSSGPSSGPSPVQPNGQPPANPYSQLDMDKFVPFGVNPETVAPGRNIAPRQAPGYIEPDAPQPALQFPPQNQNDPAARGQAFEMPQAPRNWLPNPAAPQDQATWRFSFYRAPWETVIRNFAQENGLSLVVSSMPNAEFNYFDQRTYTVSEAIDILNDHLIPLGFLLIRNQGKLTLISRQTGINEGVVPFVSLRDLPFLGRNEMATVAFPLRNASIQNTIPEIQQLMSSLGSARILSSSNRLVVTDTGAYLMRMRDLLGGYGLAAGEQETVVVHLRNTKAESMAASLNQKMGDPSGVRTASTADPMAGGLGMGGPIAPIKETNCLLVTGTSEEVAHYQGLIAELDRPPSQVVIQGLLLEVNLGNTNEFGAELGLQDSVLFDRSVLDNLVTLNQTNTAPNGVQTTNQTILSQTAAPGFNFNNAPLGNNVAVSPSTVGSQGLSSLGLGRLDNDLGFGGLVLSASSQSVSALLRALAARYQTEILSRPQIRTVDNSEALIQIGQQVPVVDGVTVTPVGSANPIIRQDRAGIILRVTPRISPDGLVQIKVEAEKSAFRLAPGSGVPVFADAKSGTVIQAPIKDLTTAQTTVSARAGQTIVLGGMITTDETNINRKVPFLGDIPLLGRLFRYDKTSHVRKELLIFLTPQIINCDEDSENFKATEMQRVQINMEKLLPIHGNILEQTQPNIQTVIPSGRASEVMLPEVSEARAPGNPKR